MRITSQAPLGVRTYALERLRCGLCGEVFTAALPQEASREKYDARAGAMIGLLKYGSGLPFNRLQGLQGDLEIPLPTSTQWDVVSTFAPLLNPAFEDLMREAAQGTILYNDDSTVKILTLMGELGIFFAEHAPGAGDDRRQLPGPCPPAVRGDSQSVSRRVWPHARSIEDRL